MPHKHIVKSYDKELEQLQQKISEMGKLAALQLSTGIEAFIQKNSQHARLVVETDATVDNLEQEIHQLVVHLLASRQPLAVDLRTITSALQIATDLERIADYAENIAKQVMILGEKDIEPALYEYIINMTEIAQVMLKGVLESYEKSDVRQSHEVWKQDAEIDTFYAALLSKLQVYMKDDSQNVNACTSLLFIARCLERIGDHIKNVAEHIHFITTGELFTTATALE